ncbi:MAG: PAS domain S-box protein [Ktedonobacteraceae bacterium]
MAHGKSKINKRSISPCGEVLVESAKQGIPFDPAAILDSISDALICIDRYWLYRYVNAQAEHILGKRQEELLGKCVWELWPSQIGSIFFQKASEVFEKQISLEYTEYHDLLQQWLTVRIAPVQDGITVFLQIVTERKHAEEQQRFHATILHNVTNSIVVTDLEGRILYCNEEAQHIFGYSAQELLGQKPALLYPNRDEMQLAPNLQAILNGKDSFSEWLGQRKDGTQVWVEIKTTILRNSKGEPSGFIEVAKDITDRKQVEGALHLQQQEFQAIAEHAPDIIARFDSAYRHLYVNPAIEAVTGLPSHTFIGKTNEELGMPAHLSALWKSAVHTVLMTGQKSLIEFRVPSPAGHRWFESRLVPEWDEKRAVASVLVISRDITDRKRLEGELQTAKDQLEAILYNVNDGIMVQDATGKIIYANLAAAHLAGCTSVEELLHAPLLTYLERIDITDEQGCPLPATLLPGRRAIQGETPVQLTIRCITKETQEVRWVRLMSTAIAATDQISALVITVIQDITHFKELEQRKDEFILNVSHELRTPLTAANGYLELLKEHDEQLDPLTRSRFLQQALDNGNELTRLVNSILDALRTSHIAQPAQQERLSVAQAVWEVLAQFDPQQMQARALQVHIPEQLFVWADPHAFHQVLRNVLSNAFKYAPSQAPIMLNAAHREEKKGSNPAASVCICVQDAGPGIPLAEQPLLFQKFVRLKRDLSGTVRGTGLGLYISKQLIEAMGGDMWVESSGRQGEGSRFCFTLLEASHITA